MSPLRAPLEPAANRHLALVVPITNFDQLVLGNPNTTTHATFGAPLLWDLGGLGVREIRRNASGQYLILAGSVDAAGLGALYVWDGVHAPVKAFDLPQGSEGSNWEGFMSVPDTISPQSTLRLIGDRGDAFIYGPDSADAKDQGAIFRSSRTRRVLDGRPAARPGAWRPRRLGSGHARADARHAGLVRRVHAGRRDRTYTASTSANVISTAGDAALSVSGPGAPDQRHVLAA